jgi:hypothetical protein
MTATRAAADLLADLKEAFRAEFGRVGGPRSLFLIGSLAGHPPAADAWYHDFDVHLYFDEDVIPLAKLDEVRGGLNAICDAFAARGARVGWELRDRHWKLVPDPSAGVNLSIHATLANAFDYRRRALHNPVLGWNMYRLCEVLHGDHPGVMLSPVPPSALDHLHGVGGIGWMIENFYRALWLHFADPGQTFFPYIAGYCWNVLSSITLQFFSLSQRGRVATRREAYEFTVASADLAKTTREDLALVRSARYTVQMVSDDVRALVNATARAASELVIRSCTVAGLDVDRMGEWAASATANGALDCERTLSVPGAPRALREVHRYIAFRSDDFYAMFAENVELLGRTHPGATSMELFEAVEQAVACGRQETTRLYFWSDLNAFRLLLSHDFARARRAPCLAGALWGWEDGAQALLQRLNERYIRRGSSREGDALAELSRQVATENLEAASLPCRRSSETGLTAAMEDLARWLATSRGPGSTGAFH